MMLRRSLFTAVLFLASLPVAALAQEGAGEKPEEAAKQAAPLPPVGDEVQGTCRTPRQAWLQLLYWTGDQRDLARAMQCFDVSGLRKPKQTGRRLAENLVEHLDSTGREIDTDIRESANPNYTDPQSGEHLYRAPAAPMFVVAKQEDGRWLFTPSSLDRIPEEGLLKRLSRYLPGWFRSDFLGIQVWSFFGVLLLVFIAFVVQKLTVFIIRTYVNRLVSRSQLRHLRRVVSRADRPIGGLSMAMVFYVGFPMLLFPVKLSKIALIGTEALAAFSMVWLAYRLIDVLADWMEVKADATSTKLDDQLVPLVTKSLKVFVSVVGGIFVLQNIDVDVGSLLAGVGLGGLAFALAARDTVANFFGSLMIFIDKPFQIGDWVVVGECEGVVEEVGFRTTRVRTFYNSLVTMPNAIITTTKVDNYGVRQYRRYSTTLSLTYDTPPEKVQAFCEGVRALIAAMPGMRKDFYMVEFKDYGDSGLLVMVYTFIVAESWDEEMRTRSNLNLEILRLAKELGVSFAFPTRTLHVDSLAQLGEAKQAWSGSTEPNELRGVIESFGPGGAKFRPRGFSISSGFDATPDRAKGSDEDGG